MRDVLYFLGLSLGVVALGCSSSATTTTVIVRPELVAVSPDDVLGVLPSASAAQVQSYVATLFDITPDTDGSTPSPGFQLASSPPTSVQFPVTFSFVVTGHRYLAVVDLYDRAPQSGPADSEPKDIAPSTPGGRRQFDKAGALVSPLTGVTCGGYPASPGDGGSYGGAGSLGEMVSTEAGAAGAGASDAGATGAGVAEPGIIDFPPGIYTYDGITQTTHNCVPGLPRGTN